MVHIKVNWKCPICMKNSEVPTVKPHWNQPRIEKYKCPMCLSQWQIKVTRVQGIVALGRDIELFQTLIRIGAKATKKMIANSIKEGKRIKEGKKKSFWQRLFGK